MSPSASVGQLSGGCAYCMKEGLPILPLRYAVARSDMGNAPHLSGPFGAGVKDIALPDKLAHYTLRLLRSGFLYVYDERYGRYGWKGYQVDEGGYMMPFDPLGPPSPSVLETQEFSCARTGDDPYVARCFTVRDAAKAKRIWLGFSDVLWTPAVLKRHMSEDYRNAHMRVIDVAKVRAGSEQPHARKLDSLGTYVAEYAATPVQLYVQTAPYVRQYLPIPFTDPRQLLAHSDEASLGLKLCSGLVSELLPYAVSEPGLDASGRTPSAAWAFSGSPLFADATRAKAMENWAKLATMAEAENEGAGTLYPGMVALDDPAGIAMELAGLIKQRTAEFTEEPKRKWKHETALTIQMFKRAVEQGAVKHAEGMVDLEAAMDRVAAAENSRHTGIPVTPADYARQRAELMAEATQAGEIAWNDKYATLLQGKTAPEDTIKAHHADWLAYEQQHDLPALDQGWLAWVQATSFKRYFTHNYDAKDFTCGAVYAEVLGAAVDGLFARKTIAKYLTGALAATPSDHEAVFARALGLNDDRLIEKWMAGADQAHADAEGEAFDGAASGVYSAWAALMGGNTESYKGLAKYVYRMSRGVLDTLGAGTIESLMQSAPRKLMVTLLGTLAKMENPNTVLVAMRATTTTGERASILNHAIAKVLHANTGQYRSAAEHIVKDKTIDMEALVLVDRFELLEASAGKGGRTLSGAEVARAVSVDTLDDAISRTAARAGDAASEAGMGVVGFLLTSLTCRWTLADARGAEGAALVRSEANLVAQGATLTGATFDAANGVMKAYSGWRMGAGFAPHADIAAGTSEWLTSAGKLLGGLGGVLAGLVLVWQGYDEVDDGHTAIGHWDELAGVLTVVGGVALFFGWTGIGIVVAVAAGLLLMIISYFRQDPIQNWIEQTPLGDGGLPQFKGLVPQVAALNVLQRA